MTKIIDGKMVANQVYSELEMEFSGLRCGFGKGFRLAVITAEPSDAGRIYLNCKKRACLKFGIDFEEHEFDQFATTNDLIECIKKLNTRDDVTGILVQLPLPASLDTTKIVSLIKKTKDVDCLNPANFGKLALTSFNKDENFAPCTALAILKILEVLNTNLEGKHVVILGRSAIIGKPLALLMLLKNATVTICHSKSKELKTICKSADILVSATGVSNLVTGDMVKQGTVVIDAGTSKNKSGKVCGDIDCHSVSNVASYLSPVPKGVGPVTVAMLLKNIVLAAKKNCKLI